MDDDKRRKLDETMAELDLRLGGLLGKLGGTLSEVIERLEAGDDGEVRRVHHIPTPRGHLRAETGVRIRVGALDGSERGQAGRDRTRPVNAAPSGDTRPERERRSPASRRPAPDASPRAGSAAADRPHVESYTEGARWVLCADLPGVTLPEVDVRIDAGARGPEIAVATTGARRYALRHPLPPEARPDDMQIVLRNGVLEVTLGIGEQGAG